MQNRFPDFAGSSTRARRDGTPSDWRSAGEKQTALPPIPYDHGLKFIPVGDVYESDSAEAWAAWDAAVRAGNFRGGRD